MGEMAAGQGSGPAREHEAARDPEVARLLALCAQTSTATTYHLLEGAGYPDMFMAGLTTVAPGATGGRFAGLAVTLRFLPRRRDLAGEAAGVPAGANPLRVAVESIGPDQVLVVDAGGNLGGGILGDVLSTRIRARGGAGIVVDGAIRDLQGVREAGIPVVARGVHPAAYMRTLLPADLGRPVCCGGVAVVPGDLIMADPDGVLVIPRAVAAEVLAGSVRREGDDLLSRRLVGEGYSIDEAYPLSEELRRRFGRLDG
jgi:regulator of RNase E activity RraA